MVIKHRWRDGLCYLEEWRSDGDGKKIVSE